MTSHPKNLGGRPANDPGPLGWSPDAAQEARLEAGLAVRVIREQLAETHGIALSERAVEHYFLPVGHKSARPPRAATADAIAKILGVARAALGVV